MVKKRTFRGLKQGSYFWEAGVGCVTRRSVMSINYNPGGGIWTGKVRIAIGYNADKFAYVDGDATEFTSATRRWFTDKEDARKCAYQLILDEVKNAEIRLNWLKERADACKERYSLK